MSDPGEEAMKEFQFNFETRMMGFQDSMIRVREFIEEFMQKAVETEQLLEKMKTGDILAGFRLIALLDEMEPKWTAVGRTLMQFQKK